MNSGRIVVTGGSGGIGAAIVRDLTARGFDTVSLSRSGEAPAGRSVACDMTDERAVREAMAKAAGADGLVGLVNNAGVHEGCHTADLATDAWRRVMDLNATAVFVAAREAHPHLKAAGGGLIINIGSFFDKLGVPDNLAYCASKAAVAAMTRCMAVEWASDGIRALTVAPGYVETDLNASFLARPKVRAWMAERIPAGGPAQPSEVARLVGALFSEGIASLTGETIYLDGGQGMNH